MSVTASIAKLARKTETHERNVTSSKLTIFIARNCKVPIAANFKAYPAKTTDPAHEAST